MTQGLATKLREGTAKAHTAAENADFIKCFLKGVVDKESYRKLVANFYFVYKALEEEFEKHKNHPVLSKLFYSQLWREKSLERDLTYYYGANWREVVQPSEACQKYVARIHEISAQEPELLVSHAYTRYMGDLSGGQILQKIAKQAMGLNDSDGTAFYEFEAITNHGQFKKDYRNALDTLEVSPEMQEKIVAEANHAFHLNMEMFQELKGNWGLTLIKLSWNSLKGLVTSRKNGRTPARASQSTAG
ncbi:Heme oxygenase [Thalassoporum mexicanum PCC 7367]|uniref:biliverdin-producing heme oxygenase n=1 Tax=Thalassoporum mexicanum TaxID=3457544 RepID=UPI00029FA0F6|nr:biliverdin-producing heme oxygenase [Pseudanabaena sp. PCC 7367]AFY70846.1 Heme oxygenase [Pseudanabaena sp. PCC 7367]